MTMPNESNAQNAVAGVQGFNNPAAGMAAISPATPSTPILLPFRRREEWVDLDPENYEGYKFKMWVNYPRRIQNDIESRDEEKIAAALAEVVLEHNGWADPDGKPYPQPNVFIDDQIEDEDNPGSFQVKRKWPFWEEIPTEIASVIILRVNIQVQKLPNSVAENYRASRRGQTSQIRRA